MARPTQKRANIQNIKNLLDDSVILDLKPLIAMVMRECNCTFDEIGQVFDFTRQNAEQYIKGIQDKIE